ncbi:MAG TPA: hypothetical protein VGA33_03115 [Thermoanaerobaculia bacterium]
MRAPVDEPRLRAFMRAIASHARESGHIYLTWGVSVVLVKIIPENDHLLRAIPELKEKLQINVELASPADFVPELPGWQERSPFIAREGLLSFHHYDFYSQALSKLERAHRKDLTDVNAMVRDGLVEPKTLLTLFERVAGDLFRYPAIDPATLRSAVERFARD